ncbi:MAG: DUF1318 domain-containing protein [Cardiobacteriaceae bacterium]|nr:DUF1318 domain-containing protein [Cardiobacteriaceae bacterium]
MFKRSLTLFAPIAIISCVTVNIYFPAAAVEKAADQIIQDVWKQTSTSKNGAPLPANKTNAKKEHSSFDPRRLAVIALNAVSKEARAQSLDFNATSPQIEQIKARMANRFTEMSPFLDNGAIGLTSDGLVAVHNADAVGLEERARMNQLVNAENKDRKALYQAIADANNHPDWAAQIQQTFAECWISQAKGGWWYQAGGSWEQK